MAIHWLPTTPVNLSDGISTYTFPATYPPITLYKPPLSLTPQFQSFSLSSSNRHREEEESFNNSSSSDLQQFPEPDPEPEPEPVGGIEVEVEKVSKKRRRIRSKVGIDASLETVWGILTDYERLADIIPSLVVSEVIDKGENFARLLQIGEQKLAFGIKFSAKGVVDCYEQDFEVLPNGQRRDIEFKMIEGDFTVFEGKWSIEQYEHSGFVSGQQYDTTLLYTVEVEPKMWLPVQLVEGRFSKEIQMNLFSIREEAQRISNAISSGEVQ